MKKFRFTCTILLLLGLASCDQESTRTTNTAQPFPEFDSLQKTPTQIEQMEALLASDPDNFNALSSLGDLYFESSRYLEAIQVYNRAIAVNPSCADCFNDRGLASFYIGDAPSALESFDQAVTLNPGYTHAWLSKGFVLTSIGRYQEAVFPLNKVKELDTTGQLAAEADKFLALAKERSPK